MPASTAPPVDPSEPSTEKGPRRSWRVKGVAIGVAVELAGALALALNFFFVAALSRGTDGLAPLLAMGGIMLVFTAALGFALRGMLRARRWARSLIITWQLFQALVSMPLLGGEQTWLAVIAIVLALGVGITLLLPSTARETGSGPALPHV